MHDGRGNRSQTLAAPPPGDQGPAANGYSLVTVPELVLDDPSARGQRLPDGHVR